MLILQWSRARCSRKHKKQAGTEVFSVILTHKKKLQLTLKLFVRVKGLEPSHLAAPDPKSGVSTNFTIPATIGVQI
ncbi:hypothetical protein FBBAL38_04030 [Flavobacteria bacterium BAL38]|nr:hypothetical protein FBBAL38_04030 [Flavobacteria bacterium BAL38]